jgi:hypothetical protein
MVAIFQILAIIFLCSICFFPLLRFAAPPSNSLNFYLLIFILHSVAMIGLSWFVNKTTKQSTHRKIALIGIVLFFPECSLLEP